MPCAARTAVTVVFFASGAAYGRFVWRIPALKSSAAELGLVLLAGAIGFVRLERRLARVLRFLVGPPAIGANAIGLRAATLSVLIGSAS